MKNNVEIREEQILRKYYEVDRNIVHLRKYYHKSSELLDNSFNGKRTTFNTDELKRINQIIDDFPSNYQVSLDFYIDEYDEKVEVIDESIHDCLELYNYKKDKKIKKKWIVTVVLMLIGILILFVLGYGDYYSIFNTPVGLSIFHEVFTIVAWVFIWQAVLNAFWERLDVSFDAKTFKEYVVKINFYDKEDKLVLEDNPKEKFRKWISEHKGLKRVKIALLLTGTAFLVIALYNIVDIIYDIFLADFSTMEHPVYFIITFILNILFNSLYILGSLGAISLYANKNRFIKATRTIAVINLIIVILSVTGSIIMKQITFKSILMLVICLVFSVSLIIYDCLNKKQSRPIIISKSDLLPPL